MTDEDPPAFSLSGALRRIRRSADMSQRELAAAAKVPKSTLAAAEAGTRSLPVDALVRTAAVAGLRLALLDPGGAELAPMADGAVRDMGARRFPAHLDTRYSEEGWWHGPERYDRPRPWYTFDLDRARRSARRLATGAIPDDHQLPRPGDSPEARSAARRREADRRQAEDRERRRVAGLLAPTPDWVCDCPPECADLEDWAGPPKHTSQCPCRCDVG